MHVERVEQCGSRTVITSSGIIHDNGPNSTGGVASNDTEGLVLFILGDKEYCNRTSAGVVWNNGVLDFHVLVGASGGKALYGGRSTGVGILRWQCHLYGPYLHLARRA